MPRTIQMTDDQIIDDLTNMYGTEFTAGDVRGYCAANGIAYQTVTRRLENYKVGRGKWNVDSAREQIEETYKQPAVLPTSELTLVPQKDDTFVKFGNFNDVKKIIQSRHFYPTFITGLSGNGKTFSVEQACAQLGRELIRVNIILKLMKMTSLVDSVLSTVRPFGTMVRSSSLSAVILLFDEIDLKNQQDSLPSIDPRR